MPDEEKRKHGRSTRIDTIATHGGDDPDKFLRAASPAIVQTSTFVYDTYEGFEEAFHNPDAFIYTRGNNPTVRVAETKIAQLEGAEACRLFGSGMAAISASILNSVRTGDHIVTIDTVYGPARNLMLNYLPKFGVETTFIDGTDPAEFAEAMRPNTRLFYLESPSSFFMKLQDLQAVTALARANGIRTAIDNSYSSPLLQRPLELGVDLSVYSVTKYLNGHSDVVAGAVTGSAELVGAINKAEFPILGGVCSPFDAWLIARGLRTLPARMRQHRANVVPVVDFLAAHPRVRTLYYPGHPSHPQYELAQRQMKGASSLLSFEIDTDEMDLVKRFINALQWFPVGVSWGGHESLLVPYGLTQGRTLPAEKRRDGLLRVHIGLEDPQDLVEDLDQAFAKL